MWLLIGVQTGPAHRGRRDGVRASWKRCELHTPGVLVCFLIGRQGISAEMLATLEEIANDRRRDVILSPRPQNGLPIYAVSWGRVLAIDGTVGVEEALLRDFVTTNSNRSPEPNIRGAGHR